MTRAALIAMVATAPAWMSGCGGGGGGGDNPTPAAPTSLAVQSKTETTVVLRWVDASSNETGFEVQLRTGTAAFATVGTAAPNATGYTASGLTTGTPYDFRVRAVGASGSSGWAGPINATPAADPTTTGTVRGRVLSLVGAVPIIGAQITIGSKVGNSGTDGRFSITGVPLGNQAFSVSATNYVTSNTTVTVLVGDNNLGDVYIAGAGDGPPPPPDL